MRKLHILTFVLCAAAFAACSSNDDNFTPGDPAPSTSIGAYIASDYEAQTVYEDQPLNDTLWFSVVRTNTTSAVEIPIQVDEADTAIHVPTVAQFAVGQDTAKVPVTFPYVKLSKDYPIAIHIDESYCNPYAKVNGGSSASCSILWSDWDVVCDSVLVRGSYVVTQSQGCKLLNFRGQNRFRLTNFLNSGIPFEFSINGVFDSSDPSKSHGKINPLTHFYDYGSSWIWGKSNWEEWTPVGMSKPVNSVYFWPSYNYDIDLDFRVETPSTYKMGGKTYTYDYNKYGMTLNTIGGSWEYLYFFFYYENK